MAYSTREIEKRLIEHKYTCEGTCVKLQSDLKIEELQRGQKYDSNGGTTQCAKLLRESEKTCSAKLFVYENPQN